MCLGHYIKLIWESPTTEDKNLHRHLHSFHSKLESTGWLQPQVFQGYFFNSCNCQGNIRAFRLTGLLRWQIKKWLDFSSIFFKICRFRSLILLSLRVFIQRGATLESGLPVARFFSTNHNSLLCIATNEIASFCIDHRSRQMAFLRAKAGQRRDKKPAFALCWNILK